MKVETILRDYENSLEQLKGALEEPASSDLLRAGCIKYFEFCFELAWKSIKKIAEDQGFNQCTSPKKCHKLAFSSEWVDEEDVWMEMLSAHNRMSHTYDPKEALKVYDFLARFCETLEKLLKALKREVE